MANGLMGSLALPDANTNLVATVTLNCLYAIVDILVLNPSAGDVAVEIAITPNASSAPSAENYIEKGGIAKASGGTVAHYQRRVSPGSKVFVKGAATVVASVVGQCITKRQ